MITRSDVQRVIDAFILEETLYWWLHPIEQVNTVRGIDAWDGYHWLLARQETKLLLPSTTTPLSSKRAWDHECVGQSGQNRL